MTSENIEPTNQVEKHQPSANAPKRLNIIPCVVAVLVVFGLFVLASFISWEILNKCFLNLTWKNPFLMMGAAAGSMIMFMCFASTPRDQLGKHSALAEVMMIICGVWLVLAGLASIMFFERLPSERRYVEIMNLAPEQISSDSQGGLLADGLKVRGEFVSWINEKGCQSILHISGPDMKYSLSINGKPLGSCKSGLNVMEWKYKGE